MRQHEFTPAAERAFQFASRWQTSPPRDSLTPPQLLLGLLAEPECRAALLLAAAGIHQDAPAERWPEYQLMAAEAGSITAPPDAQVLEALQAAELRLAEYPRPLVLATEHLLLGLAAGENDVATWLRERGLDAIALEEEIHRLAGHTPGPLNFAAGESQEPLELPDIIPAAPDNSVWRIIDAAANRASEGLRVVEDYARFALDDRHLTGLCKSLRHELTAVLDVFPNAARHAARETRQDVGADLKLAEERARSGLLDVLAANFKRVEQALRSLEEYAKTSEPAAAAALERLRYRAYTLERAMSITADSRALLSKARLYVLVDGRANAGDFLQLVDTLVAAEVDCLQLRDKRLPDRELLARARLLRERTAGTRTLFIMNDRPDLAVLAQADGVHVGQDELTVKDTRAIVGPQRLIGVSTHSLEQARAAVLDGANYIGVGPTFASTTKQFDQFAGLDLIRQVASEIGLPAFAVGGVNADNVAAIMAAGLPRVAVCGAVIESAEPARAVAELKRLLG